MQAITRPSACKNPVRLNDFSEPEPDVALLRPRADRYRQAHPTPADVLLLIEVADTTAAYDRHVKVPLYARSDIPEVWLVDLQQNMIEVYARPVAGAYQVQRQYGRGERVSAETLAQLALDVDAALG
jgi:Uma2 family endonuclease